MRILFLGDVVGHGGRRAVIDFLPEFRRRHHVDFTIVNGDNAAHGFGLTGKVCEQLFEFSFMNLLPYLLALAGAVVALLAALSKKSFLLNIIAVACFVAAAVFFFTAASYVSVAGSEGSGTLNVLVKNIVDALKDGDNLKIAIGSILGGAFSVVAAACSALKIFVK